MITVMQAVFVELPAFERNRESYLDDGGFGRLQEALMANPEAGEVIPGTGGLRKVRFSDARRSAGDLLLLDGWPGVLAVHTVR
jgi:hypothetical protein